MPEDVARLLTEGVGAYLHFAVLQHSRGVLRDVLGQPNSKHFDRTGQQSEYRFSTPLA